MIISLHTPKAAGSFQRLLRKHYFIWLLNTTLTFLLIKIDERHAEVLAFRESFGSMKSVLQAAWCSMYSWAFFAL